MWIVRVALDRPYSFIVLALLILILSPLVILRTPTDIFPNINIPVIAVGWSYTGLSPEEMEGRLTTVFERSLTTLVDNIQHIESTSYNGQSITKIFLQPGASLDTANAQVTAASQTLLRQMPQGTQPPLILNYSASSVPILQLGLSGPGFSEQALNDLSLNFLRTQLVTVPGSVIPYPYGGKQRQVMITLNPARLQAKGLSPGDVLNSAALQYLVLPSGTVKISQFEYDVRMNGTTRTVRQINDLPIKTVGGATIYLRDVATVADGFSPQTNIARKDGQRGVLVTVLKAGNASTISVVNGIRAMLPAVQQTMPPELKVQPVADQSIFVKAAVTGVIQEAVIAAGLTALMILLFLGSWRSTLIIAVSIPLSILTSVMVLSFLGQTINIMTLGGLALAVGILVDDATVTIENIERYLEEGQTLREGILNGAAQIAVPALVSTLCICIVFVPMFLLNGVARYLFVPLAEAVVFAMLASYVLSRTLVPTMAMYLLRVKAHHAGRSHNPLVRFQQGFERRFEQLRHSYHGALIVLVRRRALFIPGFMAACVAVFILLPFLGQDFFPNTDSGQFILHMRAKTGTRIEETARLADLVEDSIRRIIPPRDIDTILDNIGLPYSTINLTHTSSGVVGAADADIMVQLNRDHRPTAAYVATIRRALADQFPGVTFYTLPADMITQVLNFGIPSPIDIQIDGADVDGNREVADRILNQVRGVPGVVDARIQQQFDYPDFEVTVDRTKAQQNGLSERDVASSIVDTLSGSFQTAPMFFLNPGNGVNYQVAAQAPQYAIQSIHDLQNVPVTGPTAIGPAILADVATIKRSQEMAAVDHYNIRRVIDIYTNVQGRDLGAVGHDITRIVDASRSQLPRGSFMRVKGQIETMNDAYLSLAAGLGFSILFVYLLIVVNFQSWLDPFIIITALPAALSGIVLCLFFTGTTLSVPALMGAIMCMGVATANSILMVSFARERLAEHGNSVRAATEAGFTRFRPVLMTALAMIIGMVPMSLGLGDGGEQNAPLGRAVIGGLLLATVATLVFVPTVFSLLHARRGGAEIPRPMSGPKNLQPKRHEGPDHVTHEPHEIVILGRPAADETQPGKTRGKVGVLVAAGVLVLLGFGIYAGIRDRADAEATLATETLQTPVPVVDVIFPAGDAPDQELLLPGQTVPFSDAPIYARTSGYLKRWTADIGAHVKQGDLLAQIEAPELDQQLRQARADLATAQANAKLAGITAQRTESLLKSQSVSTQERDNTASAYIADQSIVVSRQADVERLEQLQSYENVYAPFDGVITVRNTDVGHLINAGAGGPAAELFHLTAIKVLRIYVAVPETDSPAMKVGATPTVTLDEYPGEVFHGRLVRTDNAINPTSRTLRVEVDVDNADGRLLPGSYVFVHFVLPGRARTVTVPSNVLLFRSEGLRVGVVRDGIAQLVPITIGRDYGDKVEVLSGLSATDQVILNPSDSLIGGTTVRLASSNPNRKP